MTDEIGYDSFHEHGEQIYRMNWDFSWNGTEGIGSGTPPPLAARLVSDIPNVEDATRVYPVSPMVVRHRDRFFVETLIRAVDPNFLDVFSFDLVAGDETTALRSPNSVVLTIETARKYFGEASPLGKTITIGESGEFLGRHP